MWASSLAMMPGERLAGRLEDAAFTRELYERAFWRRGRYVVCCSGGGSGSQKLAMNPTRYTPKPTAAETSATFVGA